MFFLAGWFFFPQEYKNEDANQDYIIKSVTHSFKKRSMKFIRGNTYRPPCQANKENKDTSSCWNTFCLCSWSPGEEIWTDNLGRIKVKFHWDRSDKIMRIVLAGYEFPKHGQIQVGAICSSLELARRFWLHMLMEIQTNQLLLDVFITLNEIVARSSFKTDTKRYSK